MINIIAAVADNGALGRDNQLLWHISEDLKFFKRTTLGCPVVMGRRTFESLGRALPGRLNVVVSRKGVMTGPDGSEMAFPEGVVVVDSLEKGLAAAEAGADNDTGRSSGPAAAEIFIIGGGEIYRQAMPLADRIYITEVHISPEADTFFPTIDPRLWREDSRSERCTDDKSGLQFEFVTYVRR